MDFNLKDVLADFLSSYTRGERDILHVLVAVSGGADSMALLNAASTLADGGRLKVVAAHINHHPSSPEANSRARLVADFCHKKNIRYIEDILTASPVAGLSPEEWMRRERYRFLEAVAHQEKCTCILTGHHADDQAETVLLRVITGTGLLGLGGIRPARGNILRPFLKVRKSTLVEYCKKNAIPYAEDPSNQNLKVPRNLIRQKLIPSIEKEFNPEATVALCRLSDWVTEANEIIEEEVAECFKKSRLNFQKDKIVLDLSVILTYFTMIQKYTIRKALFSIAETELKLYSDDLDRINAFLKESRTGSFLEFEGGIRLVRDRQTIIIQRCSNTELTIDIVLGEEQLIPELSLKAVWEETGDKKRSAGDGMVADLDIDPGISGLVLRYAREGDRFFPLGAPGEKRLFRFLADRKVARFDKTNTLVLENDGTILWVVGHRISEKARVRNASKSCWRLHLIPINGGVDH